MCHCIERVFQLAVATFSKKPSAETTAKNLEMLVAQANKIRAMDVGLNHCASLQPSNSPKNTTDSYDSHSAAPVTYIPVSENKDVSLGIFVVKEGEAIPLHDHPHMHGVLKCLAGTLKITSFTKKEIQPRNLPERIRKSPRMLEKLRFGELFLVEEGTQTTLSPDSDCCVLEPKRSNIHRVESVGGPAAFLDILAPPYNIDPAPDALDNQERDCHYYREVAEAPGPPGTSKWLVMSDPPPSFFCDTEPYQGPEFRGRSIRNDSDSD